MIHISPEVARAEAIVALESTLIAHGLPWPTNLETALAAEEEVRRAGAVQATVAIREGKPLVGMERSQIEELARSKGVLKASARDLGAAIAQGRTAATTVAATMVLAHRAGVRVFATGGIGGAHRGWEETGDVSADLEALARVPVLVVCAGAKNILDLPRTLEMLETLSVPVLGYRTSDFPAFYLTSSGLPVSVEVKDAREAADIARAHWELGGGGVVLAQPVAEDVALASEEWERDLHQAEEEAREAGVRGKELTPFLLKRLAELTEGRTLRANVSLILANARLAAEVALAMT